MKIDISIIIATYNAEAYLSIALESVKRQSFDNWECIVVDGLSTDNTMDIIEKYERSDNRIRHISERDKGIYDAFNKGWRLAKGTWVYYLGADDTIEPEAFKSLFELIKTDDDIVYGNVTYKHENELVYKKSVVNPDSVRCSLNCSHQGFIMKREAIENMNGFSENYFICADYDLILRAYMSGYTMRYYDVDISIFDAGGVSSSVKMEKECFIIRKENHSISGFLNSFIFSQRMLFFYLRKLRYSIR